MEERDEILEFLREEGTSFHQYHSKMGLFGSFASGTASSESDIDLSQRPSNPEPTISLKRGRLKGPVKNSV